MMMSYVVDGVLLLALLVTSLRVGAMYRELKRLRGYQSQYVEVFDETSRAADHVADAVHHLGNEGRDMLVRLETLVEEARELSVRLEAAARPWSEAAQAEEAVCVYSPKTTRSTFGAEAETLRFKHEILNFAGDTRRIQEGARGDESR